MFMSFVQQAPSYYFCCIWLNMSQEYSSISLIIHLLLELLLLILSAATSSINTSKPVQLAAIHTHAITMSPSCLTHDEVCLGS